MTPEEKAKELVEKYKPLVTIWDCYYDTPANPDEILKDAKKCALIATEEILSLKMIYNMGNDYGISEGEFYEQVKTEIEKL